eukprot:g6607.t1
MDMAGFLKDKYQDQPKFPGWPRWLDAFHTVALDAAKGIAALKAKGMSQNDIKPANIMLKTESRGGHAAVVKAMVADFGLAKKPQMKEIREWEELGANVDGLGGYNLRRNCPRGFAPGGSGSPVFMAPENIIGGGLCVPVGSADVWSLGVSLFIMLTRPCIKYPAGTEYKATSFPQNQDAEGLGTHQKTKAALITSHSTSKHWVRDRAQLLAQVWSCDLFEGATAERANRAVDLLTQMMRWKPGDRISPLEVPGHPFFEFEGPAPPVPPRTTTTTTTPSSTLSSTSSSSSTPSKTRMEDLAKKAKAFEEDWDKDLSENTSYESVSTNKLLAAATTTAAPKTEQKKEARGKQQKALRAS